MLGLWYVQFGKKTFRENGVAYIQPDDKLLEFVTILPKDATEAQVVTAVAQAVLTATPDKAQILTDPTVGAAATLVSEATNGSLFRIA